MTLLSRLRIIASVALIFLPISASAFEILVDDNFRGTGMRSSRQSEIIIRYRAVLFEGDMYICGAYSSRGGATASTQMARQVMREADMVMGDQTVMRNLLFFNIVSSANNSVALDGAMANCASTGISAQPADLRSVRIDIRAGRYRVSR